MKKVLFVCTGNTCRSPMAAAIFGSLPINADVYSRGLFADGSEYCENAVLAIKELGIDISGGVSTQLSAEDINADKIFCMSESHRQLLLSVGADDDKITVLNVSDPFGGDISVYRSCRDEIKEKLSQFDIKIRPFKESDAPSVAEIEKACFHTPWSEKALLESYAANTTFFVAENSDGIVGYAGVQTAADESYVTNVAVLPNFRGFGIGYKLASALCDYAKENDMAFISLEVRKSNQNAISLYENLGFINVGLRKNFYDSPKEDAIIMTKEFKG